MLVHFKTTITSLFLLFVFSACATNKPTTAPVPSTDIPQEPTITSSPATVAPLENEFPNPYLGQDPPGLEPQIFAPGIVSDPDFTEYSGTFSADGKEYYFYRFSAGSPAKILFSKLENGKWTDLQQLAITAGYGAFEPYITLDNKYIYFYWKRPVAEGQPGYPAKEGYYVSERIADGWSEPKFAGLGMFISSSSDGQLYTTDISSLSSDGKTYLSKITTEDDLFINYEKETVQPGYGNQAHPCIAHDGSYLLFDVDSGSHLYLSFKQADGTWGTAIDLTQHGFEPKAGGAYISPDGKYLFFALNKDIWWVDIKVIENLRPQE